MSSIHIPALPDTPPEKTNPSDSGLHLNLVTPYKNMYENPNTMLKNARHRGQRESEKYLTDHQEQLYDIRKMHEKTKKHTEEQGKEVKKWLKAEKSSTTMINTRKTFSVTRKKGEVPLSDLHEESVILEVMVKLKGVQFPVKTYELEGNYVQYDFSDSYGHVFDANTTIDYNATDIDQTSGAYHTIEFWMCWSGKNSVMPFGWENGYDLWIVDGQFGFNTGQGDITGIDTTSWKDRFVHVAAVFKNGVAPNGTDYELWIDGVKQSISHIRGNAPVARTATDKFQLGCWGLTTDNYLFEGAIKDFRVWNHKRTGSQIVNSMNNTVSDTSGMILYDKLSESTSGTIAGNEEWLHVPGDMTVAYTVVAPGIYDLLRKSRQLEERLAEAERRYQAYENAYI